MIRLSTRELKARAKALYFDKHKEIKAVFVDEYGRFSYTPNNLVELNRISDCKVMKVTREGCEDVKTSGVRDLSAQKAGKKKPKTTVPAKGGQKPAGENKPDGETSEGEQEQSQDGNQDGQSQES